jgi:membrane dipeptidase
VDHIEHVVGVAGVDHVGIGPDFIDDYFRQVFGGWPPVPGMDHGEKIAEVARPADLPKLTEAMVGRGLAEVDVRKILGENVMRVLREVMGRPA